MTVTVGGCSPVAGAKRGSPASGSAAGSAPAGSAPAGTVLAGSVLAGTVLAGTVLADTVLPGIAATPKSRPQPPQYCALLARCRPHVGQ
jgi:hypothetical protein